MSSDAVTKIIAAAAGAAVLALQGLNIAEVNQAVQEIHDLHREITAALERQKAIIDYIQQQKKE